MSWDIDTVGLDLFFPLFEGHVRDVINGNVATFVNSDVNDWHRNNNVLGYMPRNSNGLLQVADGALINVADEFTIAFLFDAYNKPKRKAAAYFPRIYSKRGISTNFEIYFIGGAGNVPYLATYDGIAQSFHNLFLSSGLWRTMVITKTSGGVFPKSYKDGVFVQNAAAVQSITPNDTDLYIGNNFVGTQHSNASIQAILLYNNVAKNPTEVKNIHQSLVALCTPALGTKRFYSIAGKQEDYQDVAIFGAMENDNIADNSSNHLIGDVSGGSRGGIKNVLMPYGGIGQKFVGLGTSPPVSQAMLDFGVATQLGYTTQTFGGWCIFIPHRTGFFHRILNRGIFGNDGWTFEVSNANVVRCSTHQGGSDQSTSGGTALVAGRAYFISWLSVAGGNNYVYIELVDDSNPAVARTNPAYNALRHLNYGAQAGVYGANGIVAESEVGEFADKADFEAKAALAYQRIARSIMYRGDYYLLAENPSVYSTGKFIQKAEAGLKVISGTHKVTHEQVNDRWTKCIQCVTAGRISIPHLAINSAFGTWEAVMLKAAAGNSPAFDFIADAQDPSAGYYVYSDGADNNLILYERGVGALYTSADDVIAPNVWFRLRITRNVLGTFNIYLNDAFLGTASDTSVMESSFMSFDLDAGDKFCFGDQSEVNNLIKLWGVLVP